MFYITNSNLNKTPAIFKSTNDSMAKFMSLSNDAKLSIISNSSNINSNVFLIASDSINNQTYFAVNDDKVLILTNSNLHLLKEISVHSFFIPSSSSNSLGSINKRWNTIFLSGNEIQINNAVIQYQETFLQDDIITDYDIYFKDKRTNDYIGIDARDIHIKNVDNFSALITSSVNADSLFLTSYRPDGTRINSIDLTKLDTSILQEGSNLFFTPERVRSLAATLKFESSNYVNDTSNALISFYQDTSNKIISYLTNSEQTANIIIINTSNQIFSNLANTEFKSYSYVTAFSNLLSSNLTTLTNNIYDLNSTLDTQMSNYVLKSSNAIVISLSNINNQISNTCNDTILYHYITSNILSSNMNLIVKQFNEQISIQDSNQSNIIEKTAFNLQAIQAPIFSNIISQLNTYSINTSNITLNMTSALNANIIHMTSNLISYMIYIDYISSNSIANTAETITSNLYTTSNILNTMLKNITTDHIHQGTKNKFIINNSYQNDLTTCNLTLIGNLIPHTDSIYDLGSSNYRWNDIYLSGNSIFMNNLVISSDPITKGLVVKQKQGNFAEVIASAIKLKDLQTGNTTVLQSVDNKINADLSAQSDPILDRLTTDKVLEGSKLFFTAERVGQIATGSNVLSSNYTLQVYTNISSHLDTLTADIIQQGSSNHLIVNQTYNHDLTILGTLTACNLQVIGEETLIKTTMITADNMKILTQSYTGPSLKIMQRGNSNIAEFGNSNQTSVTITNTGKIGIGTTAPTEALHVIGNIKFTGTLNGITSNELVCMKGVTSNIQSQIDCTFFYLSSASNILSSNLAILSKDIIQYLTLTTSNQSNLISNISVFEDTSNNSNIITIYNSTSNLTSNAFETYSKQIAITSNTLTWKIDSNLSKQTSNYVERTSNDTRINLSSTNNDISNLLINIITKGWQVGTHGILYINSNVGIGTSITKAALDVNGDIRFSSNINGISATILTYLSDIISPIQVQIDNISLSASNFTGNMSNSLANTLTSMFDIFNSDITNIDIQTSNYMNATSNVLSSNLLSTANTINNRINAINLSQWSTFQGSNLYFENSVGIGTSIISVGNKLEIHGADLYIMGGTIKKVVDGRAAENYQVERWKDSANYYTQNPKFITYTEGNIGIDLATIPYSPLHVGDGTSTFSGTMTFFTSNATGQLASASSLANVCAIFDSSILVKNTIASSSDARIKKNIQDINDGSALQKILSIQPKTYEYIDPAKGTDTVYGFIAQQIKEVIPEAVTLHKNIVPNIFCIANASENTVCFNDDITKYNLENNMKISIIDVYGTQDLYKINSINVYSNSIIIDRNLYGNKVFVYGIEVDDFCALDKSYIFTLNTCATQILSEKIENLSKRIEYIDYITSNM